MSLTGPPTQDDGQAALLRLYFEKRANLVRFFAARSASQSAAEDLAQELYLKIAALPKDAEVRAPTALLYRMATNLMLDTARSTQRTMRREAAWLAQGRDGQGAEDVADEPPADQVVISRERLRRLVEAAAGLPPQMGKAFRLHKLEGRSQAETALAMGVSVKAVEKHISAALKALARKLGS